MIFAHPPQICHIMTTVHMQSLASETRCVAFPPAHPTAQPLTDEWQGQKLNDHGIQGLMPASTLSHDQGRGADDDACSSSTSSNRSCASGGEDEEDFPRVQHGPRHEHSDETPLDLRGGIEEDGIFFERARPWEEGDDIETFLEQELAELEDDYYNRPQDAPEPIIDRACYKSLSLYLRQMGLLPSEVNALDPQTLLNLQFARYYSLGLLKKHSFECIRGGSQQLGLKSVTGMLHLLEKASGIKVTLTPMCRETCILFAGKYEEKESCPFCNQPKLLARTQKPVRYFAHIDLATRLQAMYASPEYAEALSYRSQHEPPLTEDDFAAADARPASSGSGLPGLNQDLHDLPDDARFTNVYDSAFLQSLRAKKVVMDGRVYQHRYLSDPRDIILGLGTDGFTLFKRGSGRGGGSSSWVLLLVNYNLSPKIRMLREHVLLLGIIPGPNNPRDICSFLHVFIEQMIDLGTNGIRAWDCLRQEWFRLRAYLCFVVGDLPAMASMMCSIGHNGIYPCHYCRVQSVRALSLVGPPSNSPYSLAANMNSSITQTLASLIPVTIRP